MSYPNADISFPGLFGDWRFTLSPKLLDIGNGIYWYGVLIAAGLLIALWFCMKRAPRYGLTEDDVIDTVLWAIPFAIVGARVYYVLFYLDQFRLADGSIDWAETYRIWDGGLAIYGGILAAFLTAWLVCRKKQLSLWALADCCVAGFFIGQAIGRWGNFFNREAFGGMTELPWRMRLWISGTYYIDVHPTFLYESLWNVAGLPLTGKDLSMISLVSLIMLAGTVVNASIVLVDYIKQRRDRGETREEAILHACPLRIRPVLMTTLTTILALVPTALGMTGKMNEMMSDMGTTMIAGMLVSTVITLLFTPVYYCVIDDLTHRRERRKAKKLAAAQSKP